MKTIYKVLALLFCVTLLCGAIFALASSAADETDEVAAFLESIEATRKHYNYDGTAEYDFLQYDTYVATDAQQTASPKIKVGTAATGAATTGKFGRVRSVTRNGNTFYEWISPVDAIAVSDANDKYSDMVLNLFSTSSSAATVRNADYLIHEFDMATRTDFPGDISIIWEGRSGDGSANLRARRSPAKYNASTGTWEGGSSSVKVEPNQWSHITIVVKPVEDITVTTTYTKTVSTETTDENGVVTVVTKVYTTTAVSLNDATPTLTSKVVTTTKVGDAEATTDAGVACDSIIGQEDVTSSSVSIYNYGRSQGKMFWNGEFFSSFAPFESKAHQTRQAWVNSCGIGYAYAAQHTGREAGDSVAYDNNTYTIINKGTAALDALFASNAPSNLSGLTHEVLWSPSYDFPADVLGAATLTDAQGNVTNHAELKDAVAYAKANQLQGATVTLYGREYLKVAIDYPVTIQYNGYGLLNGYDLAYGLAATEVKDGDTVTGLSVKADKASTATLQFYYEVKDQATAQTPLYAAFSQFFGDTLYKPEPEWTNLLHKDAQKVYVPDGVWEFYDEKGNVVEFTEIGSDQIAKTYKAYVKATEKEAAFTTFDKDGVEYRVAENDLTVYFGSTAMPSGMAVKLYKDCYISTSLVPTENYLDLNGHSLYTEHKKNIVTPQTSGKFYIYSSASGARICVTPTDGKGSGYLASISNSNAALYVGYVNAETMCENTIEIFSGALVELQSTNTAAYFNNCVLVQNGVDNYGYCNFRDGGDAGRKVAFNNCDIYNDNALFYARGSAPANAATGDGYLTNCRVFATNANAVIYGFYDDAAKYAQGVKPTVVLDNTQLYGGRLSQNQPAADVDSDATIIFKNNSTTSSLDAFTKAGEGYVLVPVTTNNSITIPGVKCPKDGRYGNDEIISFPGTYTYAYKAVPVSQYLSTIYQNVSLDSNINANTYIPVWDYITSAKLVDSDVELLHRENIVNIAKGQYYQITLSEAPKDAWDTQTLELTFKNGNTVTFEVSLGRYAQRLLSLQSEDAYTVDSQEMMRYVLKYIKEVAVAFGGADAETIFSGIEGVDVNVDLPFEEATDLSTAGIRDYVTGATLDLESYPGFAFAIAKDFVGTVRAQLGHYASAEKTFTADAPAKGDEVLLLQNIPAYALRGTITITVTTAEGETKSAEFNLATYANYFADKPYAKAVYAYSIKASEYLRKHPEVGTLNK